MPGVLSREVALGEQASCLLQRKEQAVCPLSQHTVASYLLCAGKHPETSGCSEPEYLGTNLEECPIHYGIEHGAGKYRERIVLGDLQAVFCSQL